MSSTHYERDDRRRRSHSKSRSKSRRHRADDYDDYRRRSYSRSRSRSRSLERYKRRRRHGSSRTRSRSRDNDNRRFSTSRRYSRSSSRSRSRSRAHSHRSHKRRTHSRSRSRSSHRSQKHPSRHCSESRSPKPTAKHENSRSSLSRSVVETDSRRSRTEETLTNLNVDQENSSTQYFSSNTDPDNLENLPLPDQTENSSNANYEYCAELDEPIDKERIHREMEEKLRAALAKEGKVYPPPKPEASHPVFANDGSFLEIFKKMQEAQNAASAVSTTSSAMAAVTLPTVASTSVAAGTSTNFITKPAVPVLPIVGRRRGGKILKTGLVAKSKVTPGSTEKDFWSLYLAEVNKYKSHAGESESGKRPLLK